MSSRGSPVPRLADPPASPFQPVLPSSAALRPIVRRPVQVSDTQPAGRPFGEIGKEGEDPPENWDAVSVMSASTAAGGEEGGGNAFVPLFRDARQRRPVVRKSTIPHVLPEAKSSLCKTEPDERAPEKAATAVGQTSPPAKTAEEDSSSGTSAQRTGECTARDVPKADTQDEPEER